MSRELQKAGRISCDPHGARRGHPAKVSREKSEPILGKEERLPIGFRFLLARPFDRRAGVCASRRQGRGRIAEAAAVFRRNRRRTKKQAMEMNILYMVMSMVISRQCSLCCLRPVGECFRAGYRAINHRIFCQRRLL